MLQTIRIAKADFAWHKKGKEIKHLGHYFDVKEMKDHGEYWLVKGLYDTDEQMLEAHVNELAAHQKDKATTNSVNLFLMLAGPPATVIDLPEHETNTEAFFGYKTNLWHDPFFDVLSPPPNA